jgi:ribonuclease-3
MPETHELDPNALAAVELVCGHAMANQRLLRQALTHASRCGAQASLSSKLREANERLEFLGDALLGAALAQILFERHPESDEGHLSRLRGHLASRATLARAMESAELLPYALAGPQLGADPQAWPDSVKANVAESILAAIWLDAGWPALRVAVERLVLPFAEEPASGREDARMRVQSWALERFKQLPNYRCARTGGSDHLPEFEAQIQVGEHTAVGTGSSRRRAEAAAAEALWATLGQADAPPP